MTNYAANFGELVNRATGGSSAAPESVFVGIDARDGSLGVTAPVTGRWATYWSYNKQPNGEGAAPTTVTAPTGATAGAVPITAATGGRTKYLVSAFCYSPQNHYVMIYDRLLHIGNLSGTVTTAQTVGGTLTRNTGGAGNFIAIEVFGQIGTTARTVTASYTNQAGTSGRTTQAVTIGGTGYRDISTMIFLPLQDGDTGVQAVASITLAGTTGTAGNIAVIVGRRLCYLDVMRNTFTNFPRNIALETNTCLSFAAFATNVTPTRTYLRINMMEQ